MKKLFLALATLAVGVRLLLVASFALAAVALTGGLVTTQAQVSFGGGATDAGDPESGEADAQEDAALVCTGENLVLSIGRENPDAMARIDAKAEATPFGYGKFWRLDRPGTAPSYLYGTMHVADERATDLAAGVRERIAGADTVALEIKEIIDPALLQAKMSSLVSQSLYLDGTTLAERLTPEALAQVKETLGERGGVPWVAAQRMRPWLLMAAMSVPACETARKAAERPIVDQLIARLAAKNERPLVGLETVEEQVSIMAGLPEPLMIRALTDVARLGERMDDVFETTVALYESGQTAKIWALMRDPVLAGEGSDDAAAAAERRAGYAAFQSEVIDRRNRSMVDALEPLMARGNAFAAVGALHLPGENGMLRMLERQGWTVTPLD